MAKSEAWITARTVKIKTVLQTTLVQTIHANLFFGPVKRVVVAETARYAILIFLLLVFCPLANSIAPHATADSSAAGRSDSDAADILLVGNSYTQGNNLVSLLSQVISANDEANTSGLTGGGMRFDQHADRMNTPGDQWNVTLQNTELDWIMLQDQSQVPGFPRTSL